MSILATIKSARLGAKLGRALIGVAAMALVVFLSFKWGQNDQRADHEEELRKLALKYSSSVTAAERSAYARGLAAAQQEAEDNEELDEIVRSAEGLADPEAQCVTPDAVERLRNIQ